jgi:carboxylesterase type B
LAAGNQKSLNLGVLDEIAALEWVQANIGSFGGDKKKVTLRCSIQTRNSADSRCHISKVTIFGESAGAGITSILFLDPGLGKLARAGVS